MMDRTSTNYSAESLAARLHAEGEAVLAYFQRLTPGQWEREIYAGSERWRAREILAHFIASESGFQDLIQDVAGGGAGAPEGFDIHAFNQGVLRDGEASDPQVLMGQYAMVRERTVAIVSALSAEQLARVGRHPFLGEARVEEMVRNIYHHNSLHLRDARAALRGGPGTASSPSTSSSTSSSASSSASASSSSSAGTPAAASGAAG